MKVFFLTTIIVGVLQISFTQNSEAACKNDPPSRAIPKGGCWTGRYEPSERVIYYPWPTGRSDRSVMPGAIRTIVRPRIETKRKVYPADTVVPAGAIRTIVRDQ